MCVSVDPPVGRLVHAYIRKFPTLSADTKPFHLTNTQTARPGPSLRWLSDELTDWGLLVHHQNMMDGQAGPSERAWNLSGALGDIGIHNKKKHHVTQV